MSFHLFLSCVIWGTILAISSSDWLGVWLGMEVNLFSISPLLLGSSTSGECESCINYFIVQACSSVLLMVGILLNALYFGISYAVEDCTWSWASLLIILALITNIGVAPMHFWVPSVMGGTSWELCFILSTWQNIAPLAVLLNTGGIYIKSLLVVLGCLSSLVGGLGGILQSEIRYMLGYSSVNHAGWMLCGLMFSGSSVMGYLLLYTIISAFLFYFLGVLEVSNYTSLLKGVSLSSNNDLIVLSLFLLTLAGLPPSVGFSIKWYIFLVVGSHSIYASLLLALGSVLCIYYYSCLSFVWFVFPSSNSWETVKGSVFFSNIFRGPSWMVLALWGVFSFLSAGLMVQ